ncbi:hypothetical protein M426DRAFT_325335 [Hypoxylon sp. CI-4A]|nr:hypothetical protein M426DRAFT_325335 [Hypoxylon sp. CI-4A]
MADIPFPPAYPSSRSRSHSPPTRKNTRVSRPTDEIPSRRRSLPFVFPPLFPKNTSSTFLIPSTAEGRPIPLDGSTTAHRTTALRRLSRSQPSSRQRFVDADSPPSIDSTTTKTHSQPVVVRTYSGLPPSSTRGPVSVTTVSPTSRPSSHHPSRSSAGKDIMRPRRTEKVRPAANAKLPPLESFTFKSIIADIQQDVGADLERIAEICARTRYSLSNQYEVHIAPHTARTGFLAPPSSSGRNFPTGPTLQAVSSDDEGPMQKKRRSATRRRSVAYGTLETIMSSSRSSDEDKGVKKSAAEIVDEVRGRHVPNIRDESASADSTEAQASTEQQDDQQTSVQSKSALFATAVIETSRGQMLRHVSRTSTKVVALLSDPALPQTSRNHLETKTSPEESTTKYQARESPPRPSRGVARRSATATTISMPDEVKGSVGLLSGITAWVPWKGVGSLEEPSVNVKKQRAHISHAENTLKRLLKSTEPA